MGDKQEKEYEKKAPVPPPRRVKPPRPGAVPPPRRKENPKTDTEKQD